MAHQRRATQAKRNAIRPRLTLLDSLNIVRGRRRILSPRFPQPKKHFRHAQHGLPPNEFCFERTEVTPIREQLRTRPKSTVRCACAERAKQRRPHRNSHDEDKIRRRQSRTPGPGSSATKISLAKTRPLDLPNEYALAQAGAGGTKGIDCHPTTIALEGFITEHRAFDPAHHAYWQPAASDLAPNVQTAHSAHRHGWLPSRIFDQLNRAESLKKPS